MMMRQPSRGSDDYSIGGRPSCLAEDGQLSANHFDVCSTKFHPSLPSQGSRQICLAYLTPPVQISPKSTACRRQNCHEEPGTQGHTGLQENDMTKDSKKKAVSRRSGKRGRPTGTTKLAGYRTSTGRPLGTTKAAGFKTSPGRPLGTTKAAGYKVSPGRPPGSIKSQSRVGKLNYSICSGAAFPYSMMHKPEAYEVAVKDKETKETPKMSVQAPQFLLSGFPIRNQKNTSTNHHHVIRGLFPSSHVSK